MAMPVAAQQAKLRDVHVYKVSPDKLELLIQRFKGQKLIDTLKADGIGEPMVGATVYSFSNKAQRLDFIKKNTLDLGGGEIDLNKNDDEIDKSDYIGRQTTDDEGLADVKAPDNGVFFVIYEGCKGLQNQVDDGVNGKGIETSDELYIFIGLQITGMGELLKEAKFTYKEEQPSWSNQFYKYWNYRHPIDSADANPNIRYGFRPIVKEYEGNSVFKLISPTVVDGVGFHNVQIKRMGYDYKKNDPMGPWCNDSIFIREGKTDTIFMSDVIGKKVPGKHYTIDLSIYEMTHDGILSEKTIEVDDGREKAPLKFIDFQIDSAAIDYARYEKRGQKQEGSDSQETNLCFKVGKASLDADDIEGLKGLAKAIRFAKSIVNDENIFEATFSFEGFASPEGNYASNRDLADRRAQYLRDQVRNAVGNQRFVMKESKVQPWSVVADSLRRYGYDAEADEVAAICASTSDMNAQYAKIRVLPYYKELINDQILPLLRVDLISATYTIKKVLSASEVFALYKANPEPYLRGTGKEPYEYFHLFKKLENNFEELEPLARVAYERVLDNFKSTKRDSINRPWSLAAYHLARCLIKRKAYDPEILKPYLKAGVAENFPVDWDPRTTKPWQYAGSRFNYTNPYNDPAIALLQIEMLCGVGEYVQAKWVYLNCVNKAKYVKLGYFLDVFENPRKIMEPALREAIASTSKWNRLVVYAAMCGEQSVPERVRCVEEGIKMIRQDTVTFREDDARVHYLRARMKFDQLCDKKPQLRLLPNCNIEATYNANINVAELAKRGSMAADFMKAIMLDEDLLNVEMRWDKYISKGLYLKVKHFWEKNDPTQMKLSDENFVKKYAKPHAIKENETQTEK